MRVGIFASQAIQAASKAFCSRIAQSNCRLRSSRPILQLDLKLYRMISSANDSWIYRSATDDFARIAIRALGNRSRIARKAGSDITASPTQLVARTRMFE